MLGSFIRRLIGRKAPRGPEETGTPWIAKALTLQRLGRHGEIVEISRSVLAREPDDVDALQLLSAALFAQGKTQEGLAYLRRAAERTPESAETQANLAAILATTGDLTGAIEGYRRAVRLRAEFADAWNNLALLLRALARYDEAEECCRSGLLTDARHAALHHTLSGTLFEQGRVTEAIQEARAVLSSNPDMPSAHSDLVRMMTYDEEQDPVETHRERRAWAERYARPLEEAAALHGNDPDPMRRLRIGYVSPYFCKHAVTFFFETVIQHHDREKFDVILYADVAQPDEYSKRLQEYGSTWRRTIGLDDARLAEMMRNDAVDILVDLSGHTPRNRLLAFARRPAPIQATANTTGMASMDYRITDVHLDPPGTTEHLHTEKPLRLPQCYMAWRPPDRSPDVGPLPAIGSARITFGSFNSCFKVTPAVVALWSRILERTPDSRLKLLAFNGEVSVQRVRALFARNGIEPERLEFVPRLSFDDYFRIRQQVDVALDTYPFHGNTTTCDSLWMGLPVVVLAGTTHLSRGGVSLLTNVGLPELVAESADAYVDTAASLAADIPGLARLRAGMRDRLLRSPLTDGRSCVRALEQAYREIWRAWCAQRGRGLLGS
jgi:protein O-GlcNAc transferase